MADAPPETARAQSRRVLFADNNPEILGSLRRKLCEQIVPWESSFAGDAESAMALLADGTFHAVVAGSEPATAAVRLLDEVRRRFPQMARILLAADKSVENYQEAACLAHQFLPRPCEAEVLRVALARACTIQDLIGHEAVRRIVASMGELPMLPSVYIELTRLLSSDADPASVAQLVERDLGISSRVVRFANPPLFGHSNSIETVRAAIVYLGLNTVRNLILCAGTSEVFPVDGSYPGFGVEACEQHMLFCSALARRLAPRYMGEAATLAALLHDVGKLVVAAKLPHYMKSVTQTAYAHGAPLHAVEREQTGITHAEIGAYLLSLWGMPYPVVEAVLHHHEPWRSDSHNFGPVAVVHVANALARECESGSQTTPHGCLDLAYLGSLDMAENLVEWRAIARGLAAAARDGG